MKAPTDQSGPGDCSRQPASTGLADCPCLRPHLLPCLPHSLLAPRSTGTLLPLSPGGPCDLLPFRVRFFCLLWLSLWTPGYIRLCAGTLAPDTKEFSLTKYCSERCGGCCICSRWSCVYYHPSSLRDCAHRPTAAIYRGTVNDPTPFPAPSKTHGSYHWAFERILSAGLVPLTVASFVTSGTNYPIIDGLLGVSLVMHSHIGVRVFVYFSLTPTLLLPPCSAQPRPCRSGC